MTRLQFLTYIKQDFKRTDKDTEIYQALNDTLKDICSRGEPMEGYTYQSWCPTVVGQEDYPLPGTLLYLHHPIRLLEGSATGDSGYSLIYTTKNNYDIIEPNPNRTSPATGMPSLYTIWSNSVLLSPIPDKATYILEINWGRTTNELTGASDTSFLLSQYDEIVKWGTLMRLYLGLGLDQEGAKYAALYNDPIMGVKKIEHQNKSVRNGWTGSVEANEL